MNDLFSIKDRVAIVTGASSGLGVTFARALAGAGARVVVAARRRERLDALVAELEGSGYEALAVTCDVTDTGAVDRMVETAVERFGGVDILVNNAGLAVNLPAEEEPVEDFNRVMAINVTGTFLCAQRCGRIMIEAGRGSIINIASMLGFVGSAPLAQASYTASKGAVVNMTRELAAEWARYGVRVNAIGPGFFPSEMTSDLFETDSGMNFMLRRTPMKRLGKPDELIGPLLLLASDAGSFITGQTIVVDGGWTSL